MYMYMHMHFKNYNVQYMYLDMDIHVIILYMELLLSYTGLYGPTGLLPVDKVLPARASRFQCVSYSQLSPLY